MCQSALSGKTSFLICRVLIGAIEGGFIADLVLWLSYFSLVLNYLLDYLGSGLHCL